MAMVTNMAMVMVLRRKKHGVICLSKCGSRINEALGQNFIQ